MKYFHRKSRRAILIVSLFFMSIFIGMCAGLKTEKDFNIVLITIDALRADHLSCYGYERNTSPNIDSIAGKGIIFQNAIAPSSWTAPSVVSLLTSVYPTNHGVIHGVGYKKKKTLHIQEVFSNQLFTLTEILKANGYTTFGVVSNLHLGEHFGFGRGFDYYKCLPFLPAPQVNKTVYSWEDEIRNAEKFFLWIHYFDPHHYYHARNPWIGDYASPELTQELKLFKKSWSELKQLIPAFKKDPQTLNNLIALYDSEINFVDSSIGKLFQKFEPDDNTLIVITADHGEEFLEKDQLGHGSNLYRETINIPLIVKLPQCSQKAEVSRHVSLVDVMPTILQSINIKPPEQTLGKSLLQTNGLLFWLKKKLFISDTVQYKFSEMDTVATLKTIISPEWKYIYNYKRETGQLFNIQADSLELNDLVDNRVEESSQLKERLLRWVSKATKYPTRKQEFQLTPKEKEKLQGLGYIQ